MNLSVPGTHRYPEERLEGFARRVFEHFGVPRREAAGAARILVCADLRGIDSHGVARLSSYYGLLKERRINPKPRIRVVRESPSTAVVDGDNGLGLVVGPWSNRLAMEKAEQVGSGWVAVSHTNHYGIAGWYVLEAVRRGLIGFSLTNSSPIVAPLWGVQRMLGTNPIAAGFPAGEEPPVVVDMATSAVSYGKIEMASRRGERIPSGWGIDREGRDTVLPGDVVEGGALLPLGWTFERGGHKGYCLAALVDLLCGPIGGANWGPFTPAFTVTHPESKQRVGKGIGHFFGALQVSAFADPDEFGRRMDHWIRTFRKTRPAPGTEGPLIPGDPERKAEEVRRREGIPVLEAVAAELRIISRETGIPFD